MVTPVSHVMRVSLRKLCTSPGIQSEFMAEVKRNGSWELVHSYASLQCFTNSSMVPEPLVSSVGVISLTNSQTVLFKSSSGYLGSPARSGLSFVSYLELARAARKVE